jgi:FkbM family methyltransferase
MVPVSDRAYTERPHALAGLRQSFDVYYRDAARTARMDRLHATFIVPDAVVFDIGAHVGNRTGSFLRLGATVVALEPQPLVFRALRRIYGRCPSATLLPMAAGGSLGEVDLRLNPGNPTVATAAEDFITAATGAPGWEDQVWSGSVKVPVTTLDALIERYGRPGFVKIDVEGYEPAVLSGLSSAVPLVSFEFTTIHRDAALACIDRLCSLGRYAFNVSFGEEHVLRNPDWMDGPSTRDEILRLPHAVNSGDIYARLL